MDKLAELVGFGLVVGFLWFVWPPLVLLGAGALLVLWANTRTHSGSLSAALTAAVTAGRRAYAVAKVMAPADESQPGQLRQVV